MADETSETPQDAAAEAAPVPRISNIAQYVKDLSFESP